MCPVRKSAFFLVLLSQISYGQVTLVRPSTAALSPQQVADLEGRLLSTDPAEASAATTDIKAAVQRSPNNFKALASEILPVMVSAEKFGMADELAKFGILTVPYDPESLRFAFEIRIKIALANNKPEDALKYARSNFNVTTLKDTASALATIEGVLKAVHPGKPELIAQFKQEQIRGADTGPGIAVAETVIKSLPVDSDAEYEKAMEKIPSTDAQYRLARGSLLLMASRPAEARREFEQGIALSGNDLMLAKYQEGVARAIKAEDRLIGRANAYLLAPATPPPQDLP